MNEYLSAVLLTPVDKREEFYHSLLTETRSARQLFKLFHICLLINLHHTVEYAQLQIFTGMLITFFA